MDDSLSAIAKAIDKHIEGKPNKQVVFDVFRCDQHPSDETTYRVQNAILSALLALDTAKDVLSFGGASPFGSRGDDRLTAMRKRRQREEVMKRQRDRQDEGHREASLFCDGYGRELDCDQAGLGDRPARKRKLSRRMIEAYEDIHGADSKRNGARSESHGAYSQRRLRYDDDEDDETYQPTSTAKKPSSGEFTCSWCDDQSKSFSTASALFMHIKYKHPKVRLPLYQCKFCPANFNFQFCIERHVQMKHAHVDIVGSAYRVTPGTDGSDYGNGAGNSGKSTPNRRASLTKSKEQQDDPDYQEDEKGDTKTEKGDTKTENDAVKIKSSGGKCPKCDKSFHSIKYLEEHMAVMHSLRPPKYKCPVCSKAFTWVSNMRQHLRTMHQGAKRKRGASSSTPEKKSSKDADRAAGHDATPDLSDPYNSDDVTLLDSSQNPSLKAAMIDDDDPSYDDKTERGGYACKVCGKVFGTLSGRWRHMHNKHDAPKMRPVSKDGEVYYTTSDGNVKKGSMVNGKMKVKKMRKRMERDGEKKEKQVISDRFNYRCTLCGEKFPYPISLFNHMKHTHNSTSAGIVGTPKDGSNRFDKKLAATDGEMPPPLLPCDGMVGDTSSSSSNHNNGKGDVEEKSSVALLSVPEQTQVIDKPSDMHKKTPESDSISGSDQNANDTLMDNPALTVDHDEQYEDEDRGDTKDSFDSQIADEDNDLDKDDDDGDAEMAADSDHIEEFPSSGSSSTNPLATDETESSDSDDLDPNMPRLMCNDEDIHSDFDSPLMIDEAVSQVTKALSEGGAMDEDMDDDQMNGDKQKSLNARRPMGTGDKTCGTCGRSYHWSAGLWRHQKTTGHTGTL